MQDPSVSYTMDTTEAYLHFVWTHIHGLRCARSCSLPEIRSGTLPFSIKCSSLQIFSIRSSKYFMSSGRGLPKIIWLTCFFTSGRSKYKYNFFLHEDDVVKVLEVRGCQQYFYSFHCTESMVYIYYRHSIFYMSMPQLEPDSPTRKHKWAIPLAILSPRSSLTNSWGRSVKLQTHHTRNYND